jgi:hypothetical protein
MTDYAAGVENPNDCTDFDKRDARALTEYMTTLSMGGGVYSVTTESGSEYRVDTIEGRCTCPDFEYNLDGEGRCKHLRRVAFATGERAIPQWADTDAVDPQLGEHVDGDAPVVAATDGGVAVESDDDIDTDDERPDDCDCGDWNSGDIVDLPCWPCYRDGFKTPNPDATGDD